MNMRPGNARWKSRAPKKPPSKARFARKDSPCSNRRPFDNGSMGPGMSEVRISSLSNPTVPAGLAEGHVNPPHRRPDVDHGQTDSDHHGARDLGSLHRREQSAEHGRSGHQHEDPVHDHQESFASTPRGLARPDHLHRTAEDEA